MNTTHQNVTALQEEELNTVQGGGFPVILAAATAITQVIGMVKNGVDFVKSHTTDNHSK